MTVHPPVREFAMDIRVATTREEMGRQAASDIAADIRERLATQPHLRIVFAAAPSQREMLDALITQQGIDWHRITAFHMDEYIGLPHNAPQRFGNWLREAIFERVPFAGYELIEPGDDLDATCRQYATKLAEAPIDIVLLGVGANGHLAFNDPPADLHDPVDVKTVNLDSVCRQQQVDDRCFATLDEVPHEAITVTIPALLRASRLFCCVPGANKREAVRRMVEDPVSGACPATALRLHPRLTVYLDQQSNPGIPITQE